MQYIEAPSDEKPLHPTVFLAGGITNCPDWQQEVVKLLKDFSLTIYNPRRENFPIDDPDAAPAQIKWEYERIHTSDVISFWFSRGSVNPIVMFEYGAALERYARGEQDIVLGVDPEYTRIKDVQIQTELRLGAYQLEICNDLERLIYNIGVA